MERGERMLLAPAFAGLFAGVADVGVFTFSDNSGFVVDILAGACFFAAATFAASAPNWRIARFCSALDLTTSSFLAAVDEDDGAMLVGAEGFAGRAVKAVVTPSASLISSYSFHSSISSMPCVLYQPGCPKKMLSSVRTPSTYPSLTISGSFFPLALRWNSFFASSSVAVSLYVNGILFAFRMVSMRDVAVIMCEDPAVKDVKR